MNLLAQLHQARKLMIDRGEFGTTLFIRLEKLIDKTLLTLIEEAEDV